MKKEESRKNKWKTYPREFSCHFFTSPNLPFSLPLETLQETLFVKKNFTILYEAGKIHQSRSEIL